MKNKKFFCIEPYVGMSIIKPGHAFSCCLNEGQPITNTENSWNDPYLINIRNKFNNNEIPKECAPCVAQEKHTDSRTSRRIDSNKNWVLPIHGSRNFEDYIENDAPYKLDFWTGNICNLACATCAADDSSLWGTIQKRDKNLNPLSDENSFQRRHNPWNHTYKQEDIPNINYKNLEWVHFNGGEPLLTDTHLKILNRIPIEQRSKVHVMYNTNGTVRIDLNSDKFKLLNVFKSIDICFSLDGIEETFEYTRWPAKWESVRDNIDFWMKQLLDGDKETARKSNGKVLIDHLEISFNIVKSAFNYNKINETIEYINKRWLDPINNSRNQHPTRDIDGLYHNLFKVYLCNDHRHLDFTDEDFKNYTKTTKFKHEKRLIENLRKR